ncbi:hypothetical protein JIN84_14440 [Luteolibacter yonseiensis]|uniref:Uncharacterized protein n=1 Tax=Luteolibacter yonseiensis TaxID=1144680 RepID=A0A934R7U0_9BACT|nr:hypothetical protein [Luteolibacter yonseiensis]MBK1816820.1 hypothetical protein [Luteolibacter yonseiensis]
MKTRFSIPLVCAALVAPAFSQAPSADIHETGVMLQAASLLDAGTLRGSSYRVRDQVPTDGYMAYFTIDSDYATLTAVGVPQARRRIVEAEAIRRLVETSKGDLFAEGMKRSVEQPIEAVKNIVKHPVDSLKAAPATVGHFFSKMGSAIGRAGGRLKDQSEEISASPDEEGREAVTAEAGRGIGEAARNAVGFDKAKLATAKQLGVDPYSDNARLQEEMDKVTWAFFAGGLPLRIGAAVASAGVAVAATNMVGVPEDTYALTQSELAFRDGRSLAAMGISDEDIKTFQVGRGPLSTTRRHLITLALEAMPKAGGRGNAVLLANACETPEQVDFLVGALQILAARQRSGAADYVELKVIGRLPGAVTAAGELEVPAPVDQVTWTEQVAGAANRDDLGAMPKVLVHTGKLSQAATAGFMKSGWKLVGVEYPR